MEILERAAICAAVLLWVVFGMAIRSYVGPGLLEDLILAAALGAVVVTYLGLRTFRKKGSEKVEAENAALEAKEEEA